MSNIEIHRHEDLGVELRTYVDQGGPVVSAEDLAQSLGYKRTAYMMRILREDEVKEVSREDLGLPPGRAIRYVTESGLYKAVLRSGTSKAVEFQEWVTREVLPAIRHEGGYIKSNATAEQLEVMRERLQMSELAQEVHQVQIAAAKAEGWKQGVKAGRYSSRNDETMTNPYSDEVLALLPKYVEADEMWAIDLQEEHGGE